jgi:integrase
MKGSISQRTFTDADGRTKKCKTWTVRYSPPVRTGETRRFLRQSGFETKREAEQWFDAKKAEFAQGIVTDNRKTLKTYLEQWLVGLRRESETTGTPTASTLHSYTNHVEKHIVPAIGNVKLADLEARHIEDALYAWRTTGRRRRQRNAGTMSERTVAHIFGTLRTALGKARKQRSLPVNPCEFVTAPKFRRQERTPLDAEAAQTLLDKVGNDEAVGAAITMALGTGLRRGELCALTWANIDLRAASVTVSHSLERENGETRQKDTKTPESATTLPMAPFVVQRLRQHLKEQERRFSEARLGPVTEHTPVFDYGGTFWVPNTFGSAWKRALKKAGLAHLRLHDLRHSFGGILRENGVDLKTIQKLMRHTDYRTTANIYLHNSETLNRDAIAHLDLALTGKRSNGKARQGNKARVQSVSSGARIR